MRVIYNTEKDARSQLQNKKANEKHNGRRRMIHKIYKFVDL